jgi:hypothetical protein
MVKMRFIAKWRKWIMECVGSACASILAHGRPTYAFRFGRGIKQG